MAFRNRRSFPLSFAAVPLLFASCGDDSSSGKRGDASYVVASRIFNDEGSDVTSYLHLVPSLDAQTKVELEDAIEVPGSVKLFALDDGWLALGTSDGTTLTRYELGADKRLKKTGETIDLQPSGVQSLWDTLYVASPTKVYYADREGGQLVIINPKEMSVEGKVALPDTVREGYLALYSYSAIKRGDKLLFSVGWFDWDNDKILPETGLVVLDTKSDEVARFDVDDRCGGVSTPVTLDSGDTYYVSSALNAATKFVKRPSATPCALRVRAGADKFDADYALELGDVTGDALAGEPVPAGGDALFLRVLDEGAVESKADDASWNITGQKVWSWYKWEPGKDGKGKATVVDALDPATADVVFFTLGERVFGAQAGDDYKETSLVELTAAGGPKPSLVVPGFASHVVEL